MRGHIFLLGCLLSTLTAQAQHPTADEIVAHLRANAQTLTGSIPSISCEEQVDSERLLKGAVKDEMKIDSTFRMVRAQSKSASIAGLTESRTHRSVNGKPVTNQKDRPPFSFTGSYVNMLDMLSADKCLKYSIEPQAGLPGAPITVLASRDRSIGGCASEQAFSWRALVHADSFQLLRIDSTFENVHFGGLIAHLSFVPVLSNENSWTTSVSYAPVSLGDRTFWLPKRVVVDVEDHKRPLSLRYSAVYSACHLYTATATILSSSPAQYSFVDSVSRGR